MVFIEIGGRMENNRNILVLTTISCIFFGFIVPLIIWFVLKEKFDSVQKAYLTHLLNFELTLFIPALIFTVIKPIPLIGFIAFIGLAILWFINLFFIIKAVIKFSNDETPQFPFVLNILK